MGQDTELERVKEKSHVSKMMLTVEAIKKKERKFTLSSQYESIVS